MYIIYDSCEELDLMSYYVLMMRRCLFADHRSRTHVSGRAQRKKKKKPFRGIDPVI